jgi:hypothetical protein
MHRFPSAGDPPELGDIDAPAKCIDPRAGVPPELGKIDGPAKCIDPSRAISRGLANRCANKAVCTNA